MVALPHYRRRNPGQHDPHSEKSFGLGPGGRGFVLAIPAVGAVAVSYNLDKIRRRLSVRHVLVGSSLLVAVAALGVGLASSIVVVAIAAVVYGVGDGAAIPTLQDVAASAVSTENRGSVMAAWVASVRAGQTIGPIAAGILISTYSTTVTITIGAALFAVVALALNFAPLENPTRPTP